MKVVNFEFKARVSDAGVYERRLLELDPRFAGEDYQTDTYFEVPQGRLKLREGNIETALIYYEREDSSGIRKSDVLLYKPHQASALKKILLKLHPVKVIVRKKRRIYFVDNVKFHFDDVDGLGQFIEVEAIDEKCTEDPLVLKQMCDNYIEFFDLQDAEFVDVSYSDLLAEMESKL